MNNNQQRQQQCKPTVIFHLTGFGWFPGVPYNPTQKIIESLPNYFQLQPCSSSFDSNLFKSPKLPSNIFISSASVTETSCLGVLSTILSLQQLTFSSMFSTINFEKNSKENLLNSEKIIVWLHLGVNMGSSCFCLEEEAYNELNFRQFDVRLYKQSTPFPVTDTFPINIPLQRNSTLDSSLLSHSSSNENSIEKKENLNNDIIEKLGIENCTNLKTKLHLKNILNKFQNRNKLISNTNNEEKEKEKEEEKEEEYIHKVEISNDPGRYLCNFIYFHSLNQTNFLSSSSLSSSSSSSSSFSPSSSLSSASSSSISSSSLQPQLRTSISNSQKTSFHSLFVHVPSFSVYPEKSQLSFLKKLIIFISETLNENI